MKFLIFVLCFHIIIESCSKNNSDSSNIASAVEQANSQGLDAIKDVKATSRLMIGESALWEVEVSWKPQTYTGKISYKIQRSQTTQTTPSKTHVDDYNNISSPFVIKHIPADSMQYFIIVATTTSTNGTISTISSEEYTIKIPLDNYIKKPGAFDISSATLDLTNGNDITLTWTSAEDTSFYVIQKGTNSGSYTTTVKKYASSPYIDKDTNNKNQLDSGKTIYYMIIAVNSKGSNNANQETSVAISPSGNPQAPSNSQSIPSSFSILSGQPGDTQATLTWEAATGATGYKIKYGSTSGSYPEIIDTTFTSTTAKVSGLTNGSNYYFQVIAMNGVGSTNSSNEQAITLPILLSSLNLSLNEEIASASQGDANQFITKTDKSGNTYVLGTIYTSRFVSSNPEIATQNMPDTYSEAFLAKFNSSGAKQWVRQLAALPYNNAETYTDPGDMVFDSQGNILIAVEVASATTFNGFNIPAGNQDDFLGAVVKFDPNGNQLWTRVLQDTVDNKNIEIDSLTVDSSNNIIAASSYRLPNFNWTPRFIKLSGADGSFLWNNSITNNNDGVYYTSQINVNTVNFGGLTETFVAAGTNDTFYSVITAGSAGVCEAAYLQKFDSNATVVWSNQIGCDNGGHFFVGNIAVNPAFSQTYGDEVFIAVSRSSLTTFDGHAKIGTYDGYIIKVRGDNGNQLWSKELGAAGAEVGVLDITFDQAGNIYAAGSIKSAPFPDFTNTGTVDYFVTKYNNTDLENTSSQQWLKQAGAATGRVNQSTFLWNNRGLNINVVGSNALLTSYTTAGIFGFEKSFLYENPFIAAYNTSNGSLNENLTNIFALRVWDTSSPSVISANVGINDIVIDSNNYFYVTGYTDTYLTDPQDDFDPSKGGFVSKYDQLGNLQWIKSSPIGINIALDSNGSVYVGGNTNNALRIPFDFLHPNPNQQVGTKDYFIEKFNSDGKLEWVKQNGATGAETDLEGLTIGSLASTDSVYISGSTQGNLGTNTLGNILDLFVAKYEANGDAGWITTLSPNNNDFSWNSGAEAANIRADDKGLIYITGDVWGTDRIDHPNNLSPSQIGSDDALVIKISDEGSSANVNWIRQLGIANHDIYGLDIEFDGSGNVYIVGFANAGFEEDPTIYPNGVTFLTKFDKDGNFAWQDPIIFNPFLSNQSLGIDTEGTKLFLSGDSLSSQNVTRYALYFATFSTSDGSNLSNTEVGYADTSIFSNGMCINRNTGNLFVVGRSNNSIIDGSAFSSNSINTGFIMKFDSSGLRVE